MHGWPCPFKSIFCGCGKSIQRWKGEKTAAGNIQLKSSARIGKYKCFICFFKETGYSFRAYHTCLKTFLTRKKGHLLNPLWDLLWAAYLYLSWDAHRSMHNQKDFFQMQGRVLKKPLLTRNNQLNVTGQLLLHCKTHAGHDAGELSQFLPQERVLSTAPLQHL